ncbi:MAG: nitroreductase [Oxalobacter sp.]|nr:MAG: nitroreductase [Oxalobacter sp.]
MMKGSLRRTVEHPVDSLFADRWSPRAMSGESIPMSDLMVLFEAARWAPSSNNNQPWRILYATRESADWPLFLDLLVDANRVWAQHAAALLVFVSKTTFDHNGKASITHSFDTGAAWENLALQGFLKGYVMHGMQGFNYTRAKAELNIPDGFAVEAMAAIGKPGKIENLPEALQIREFPNERKPLSSIVCEGLFKFP